MSENMVPVAYFYEEITEEEASILQIEIGQSSAQQAAECFAVLVALRLWSAGWKKERYTLKVCSDSVVALMMSLKMQGLGYGCNLCAREVALDVSECIYKPHIVEHVRGISNTVADELSRMFAPKSLSILPSCLSNARRDLLEVRNKQLFRTLV